MASRNGAAARAGVSLRDLAATTKVSPALEDAVLVVFPESLALICTPAAYEEVMPRLALWGSALEVHCCTADELQDSDLQEAFKLRSFVAVMASVRRVRAPLSLHWRMRPHRTVAVTLPTQGVCRRSHLRNACDRWRAGGAGVDAAAWR
jgi:hypothetical protein